MSHKVVTSKRHTALDGLFRYAEFLNFGEIHIKFDPQTGLKAIVAIHNLKRGPAIGGARLVHYPTTDAAIVDAMRLSYMMSLKAAMSRLPHGGAKAVLIAPKIIRDRKAYFKAFAEFIDVLGGRYVTAVDSGTNVTDMDIISNHTPYVTCTSQFGADGNPSLHTAHGVLRSIQAAVKFKLKKDTLDGIHVAIQGAGNVGQYLAKELKALGAVITMTDVDPKSLQKCVDLYQVNVCNTHEIYSVPADVFSPCALGATINSDSIKQLKASIIVGSANNQLAHHHHSVVLHEKGILYAPDFVANAGGLIFAAAMYDHADFEKAYQQVNDIYNNVMELFERSAEEGRTTMEIAEAIAIERIC